MPENPGPSPDGLSGAFPSAFRAAVADEPFALPFFKVFLAVCLSGASAVPIFPWGSEPICDVVEQAHRKKRMRRQQPHFNDDIDSFLSWPKPCPLQDYYGF
jgi:hypothetical protein